MSAAAWLRAARLPAQSNIAVPLCLGLALANAQGSRPSLGTIALVLAFGLFDQLYIVFANDAADHETDAKNQTFTPFSGGSRVTARGELSPAQLLRAAKTSAALAVLVSLALCASTASAWPLLLSCIGLGLLYAYSFGPRLSYKGFGEVLQVAGTGCVLPLYGFVAAKGTLAGFPVSVWCCVLPLRLACALATALPDEPSDRSSDKRTLVVLLGGQKSGVLMFLLSLASLSLLHTVGRAPFVLGIDAPVAGLAAVQLLLIGKGPGTAGMLPRVASQIAATLVFEIALAVWVQRP